MPLFHQAAQREAADMGWLRYLVLLLLVGCANAHRPIAIRESAPARIESYTRRFENTNGILGLEVAARCLIRASTAKPSLIPPNTEVWLVGVTHLGTSNYYARLQSFLDSRDLVLFEGIGATNKQFRATLGEGFSLQPALARALGLRFQLHQIHYDQPRWENSDLTLTELQRHLPEGNGADGLAQLLAAFEGEGVFGGVARLGVAVLAASPRLRAIAKVMLIETLSDFDGEMPSSSGLGVDLDPVMRVLIEERNAAVIRDLRSALRRQPAPRNIAIFYGAAHMPDLERRLRHELQLVPASEQWWRAFTVDPERAGVSEWEVDMIRDSVRRELGGHSR